MVRLFTLVLLVCTFVCNAQADDEKANGDRDAHGQHAATLNREAADSERISDSVHVRSTPRETGGRGEPHQEGESDESEEGEQGAHHEEPAWWFVALIGILCTAGAWMASRHFYVKTNGGYKPALRTLQIFSVFLLLGTLIAQFWAHGDPAAYHATMHATLFTLQISDSVYLITLHFVVNDIFMCFFFGIAAKELSEAFMKPGGDLRGWQGAIPLVACLGGVVGPAMVYRWICTPELSNAWAVPCATDIAFAWLGARAVWGDKHPAVKFLLALAIADDFAGMIIIAIWYPQHAFHAIGLLWLVLGVVLAWKMRSWAHRWLLFRNWQLYLIPAILCWFGLLLCGLHAALALVLVVPFMPMKDRDEGIFGSGEAERGHDTVNRYEHSTRAMVDVGLLFFGLANAGVVWLGPGTWTQDSTAVFVGLGVGKTVGITLFTVVGYVILRSIKRDITLPKNEAGVGMKWMDVPVAGIFGAMGFTVALFVADAAGGHDALRIGALASFAFLGLGIFVGKKLCTKVPDLEPA